MSDDAARAAALRAKVRAHMPKLRADLERLVRIPSVSFPGRDATQLQRSATAVAEILAAAGAKTRILDLPGAHPAVIGEIAGPPDAPRVLLYAHHDVQPEGPADKWKSPPFEPSERDGRLYGRGAADDKAGILAHAAALMAWGGKPPVNVVVFVEGEEEAGSEHLRAFLDQERETLRCDVAVLADAANWRLGQPSITVSLRGLVNVFVEVRTADHAVHSGMYGGPLPDALTALTRLLATLHDANGDVRVPLHAADADPLDLTETELRGYVGARPGVRTIGSGSLTARLWRRPAVSVIGIDAPNVRDASNTLIPMARAKVSLRIPPGQDAHAALEALRAHLMREAPAATWGAEVTVTLDHLGEPFETPGRTPAFAAFRRAAGAAWGRPVLDVGMGGSIPFLADFAEVFPHASLLVTGVEDPASNAHSENESLHLGEFENACVAEALFLELLAGRDG